MGGGGYLDFCISYIDRADFLAATVSLYSAHQDYIMQNETVQPIESSLFCLSASLWTGSIQIHCRSTEVYVSNKNRKT